MGMLRATKIQPQINKLSDWLKWSNRRVTDVPELFGKNTRKSRNELKLTKQQKHILGSLYYGLDWSWQVIFICLKISWIYISAVISQNVSGQDTKDLFSRSQP